MDFPKPEVPKKDTPSVKEYCIRGHLKRCRCFCETHPEVTEFSCYKCHLEDKHSIIMS